MGRNPAQEAQVHEKHDNQAMQLDREVVSKIPFDIFQDKHKDKVINIDEEEEEKIQSQFKNKKLLDFDEVGITEV